MLGLGSNLMAHHLGVLEELGIIVRVASEGDRRKRYLQLVSSALSGLRLGGSSRRRGSSSCAPRTRLVPSWPKPSGTGGTRCRQPVRESPRLPNCSLEHWRSPLDVGSISPPPIPNHYLSSPCGSCDQCLRSSPRCPCRATGTSGNCTGPFRTRPGRHCHHVRTGNGRPKRSRRVACAQHHPGLTRRLPSWSRVMSRSARPYDQRP